MSLKGNMKILGLAVTAILAFSAVASAAAQAEEWTIEGQTLTERGLASETLAGSGGPFVLRSVALGLPITITCQTQTNTGHIKTGGKDDALVEFTGCEVEVEGLEPGVCHVAEPIVANTNTELTTVGGVLYDKFSPATGGVFTIITLTGEECAAANEYPVEGNVAGEAEPVGVELLEQPLRFSEAISAAAGTELTFGSEPAFLEGESAQHLSGANMGKVFGAR